MSEDKDALIYLADMRIDQLEAENDNLRTQLADVTESIGRMEERNAKLRELCADMFNGMCGYEHDCRYCEHFEMCEGQYFVGECEYNRRLRELGVEL